eukprot:CAMPEP_0173135594 /NCGR_PEP_ID=MMETSP1105-20130129/1988_1 /TAXON_ID=2985 /ORGANISM="Ochromonas sp., Strain BG-1" /LENGTH=40 /DNA_ID= /DNA_START= /DNA_END= /DNA_ORIENTATION=
MNSLEAVPKFEITMPPLAQFEELQMMPPVALYFFTPEQAV